MKPGAQIKVTPGRGFQRGKYRQFVIRIDPDTAEEVIALAEASGVRTAEQLRLLIEWGLEAGK